MKVVEIIGLDSLTGDERAMAQAAEEYINKFFAESLGNIVKFGQWARWNKQALSVSNDDEIARLTVGQLMDKIASVCEVFGAEFRGGNGVLDDYPVAGAQIYVDIVAADHETER